MEIGSEFWWTNFVEKNKSPQLPLWLTKMNNINLTSSGRGALNLLLKNIKIKNENKIVLLPSYICESVLDPFEKEGYEIRYYHINSDLTFNINSININNVGVFLHLGYFGFGTNNSLKETIKRLKKKSIIVIEDVTHTLFSENIRLDSDYYFGSIRKWIGIPSGGFLAGKRAINQRLLKQHTNFVNKRIQGFDLKTEYINSGKTYLKPSFLDKFKDAETILDKDSGSYDIDILSKNIILHYSYKDLKKARQQNYNYLLEQLKGVRGIDLIFKKLPQEVCPLFFPILIKNGRDDLRQYLINNEIYCPVHWPIPNSTVNSLDKTTNLVYNSILSIPCDQRYNNLNMNKIIRCIKDWAVINLK